MRIIGPARDYDLSEVDTPGGIEYHLTSPWDTLIKSWEVQPTPSEVKFRIIKWASLHPESERPEVPQEVQRSALDRFRNRLASSLWVR